MGGGQEASAPCPRAPTSTPVEVPALLPIAALTEVEEAGARFRYRLLGTEIAETAGHDATGRYLDEVPPGGGNAICDNRLTQHMAVNDYGVYRRLLHRTTVAASAR